jgi:hypothetical protein
MELEKESIWNDNKYAPRRKPRTGPNAAILYIQPKTEDQTIYHAQTSRLAFSGKVYWKV